MDTQSPNKPMPPRYWVGPVLLFALLSLGLYGWPSSLAASQNLPVRRSAAAAWEGGFSGATLVSTNPMAGNTTRWTPAAPQR